MTSEVIIMENTATLDVMPASASDKEYEAISEHYMNKIKMLQHQTDQDRHEIQAMRTETDSIIENIMQMLKAA